LRGLPNMLEEFLRKKKSKWRVIQSEKDILASKKDKKAISTFDLMSDENGLIRKSV
jgi:hypothetical protein